MKHLVKQPIEYSVMRLVPSRAAGRPERPAVGGIAAVIALAAAVMLGAGPSPSIAAQAAPAPAASSSTASPEADEASSIEAAQVAANNWLDRFDAGDAGTCWDMSSAAFRKAVTRDKWISDLQTVRETVGSIQQRDRKEARFTRSLPGAPEAPYVLMQNSVRYEKRGSGIETITMVRENDGAWRMAGYFIR